MPMILSHVFFEGEGCGTDGNEKWLTIKTNSITFVALRARKHIFSIVKY